MVPRTTGLSRLPWIPNPPIPPEFHSTLLTHFTSLGFSNAGAEKAIAEKIPHIFSFFPNIEHSLSDQLKAYQTLEKLMASVLLLTKKAVPLLDFIPYPQIPPEFRMAKILAQVSRGSSVAVGTNTVDENLSLFMNKFSPNFRDNKSHQIELYHSMEGQFFMMLQSPKMQGIIHNHTLPPKNPKGSSTINACANEDICCYCLDPKEDTELGNLENAVVRKTGLSRLPWIPHPPIPPEFHSTLLTHLTSLGFDNAAAEKAIDEKIHEIISFFSNIQRSLSDQLKAYQTLEKLMASVLLLNKKAVPLLDFIPYPPIPPEFRMAKILTQVSQGSSVAVGTNTVDQNISLFINKFYPNVRDNKFDQLKLYHYLEGRFLMMLQNPRLQGIIHNHPVPPKNPIGSSTSNVGAQNVTGPSTSNACANEDICSCCLDPKEDTELEKLFARLTI